MITLANADAILKSVYLDVIAEQINTKTNPFYAKIAKNSDHIVGKDILFTGKTGISAGITSTTEDGALPTASPTKYTQYRADLKNLYGTIELSDKAIRASETSAGALVNILNSEMESLLTSAKFNFGRMLYGDGTGEIAMVSIGNQTLPVIGVESTRNLVEGMQVQITGRTGAHLFPKPLTITEIDHVNNTMTIPGVTEDMEFDDGQIVHLENAQNNEIYGLEYLFNTTLTDFYGLTRANVGNLTGTLVTNGQQALSIDKMLQLIDSVELKSGTQPDMILTSFAQRKKYFDLVKTSGTNFDYLNLDGGYKALSFNGIPLVADRFVRNDYMYFINTEDFKLQQLCDWSWIQGDGGSILHQMDNKAAYQATLVKYANLICLKPSFQHKLAAISSN